MKQRIQFSRAEDDITSELHAEEDADEVRLWDDSQSAVILAVRRDDAGRWSYGGSDVLAPSIAEMDAVYETWQEALGAFGYSAS